MRQHRSNDDYFFETQGPTNHCQSLTTSYSDPYLSGAAAPFPSFFCRQRYVVIPWSILRQPVGPGTLCRQMYFIYSPTNDFTLRISRTEPVRLDNPSGVRFGEVIDRLRSEWLQHCRTCQLRRKEEFNLESIAEVATDKRRLSMTVAKKVLSADPQDLETTDCYCCSLVHSNQLNFRASGVSGIAVGVVQSDCLTPADWLISAGPNQQEDTKLIVHGLEEDSLPYCRLQDLPYLCLQKRRPLENRILHFSLTDG